MNCLSCGVAHCQKVCIFDDSFWYCPNCEFTWKYVEKMGIQDPARLCQVELLV